ncbi:MAG: ferritin-like domain-containing protein [Bacteroidota bacterium]
MPSTKASKTKAKSVSPAADAAADSALKELFIGEIKDIYWAENQLVKALPKMIEATSSPALVEAITNHLEETRGHVARLDEVFGLLNEEPRAKKCDAMEGLTKEGEGVIEETLAGSAARDTGIIMASSKVEHYEIAAYTGLIRLANKLGMADVAAILEQTLAEEVASDEKLADIAENEL